MEHSQRTAKRGGRLNMIMLIDNYDSFTYNLFQYLAELGADVTVYRNDAISVDDVLAAQPNGIVISPGPCTPNEAGICCDLIEAAAGEIPILGVCLGHQCMGQVFGGDIVRAPRLMHGKTSEIHHDGKGVFADVPSPFTAVRYHSLVIEPASMPDCLELTARTDADEIMGVRHREYPIEGVQFHPESILTQHGKRLLYNFLTTTDESGIAMPAAAGGA
jgi:para-aminobenzoate synthetase component 2